MSNKTLKKMNLTLNIVREILRKNGEISENQIKAIPFLNKEESEIIFNSLIISIPHARVNVEKISSSPYLEWDRKIFC